MKVAVVGATGLVGSEMLTVLAERNFPVTTLIPVASEKSKGKEIEFKGKKYAVVTATEAIALKPDVALFQPEAVLLQNLLLCLQRQALLLLTIHPHGAWILQRNLSFRK